jgi:CHAD domain-containing protein
MAQPDHPAYPIETLRATAASLRVSVQRCLTRQGEAAVHALRTATRRMEAQLALLALLPTLPLHEPQERNTLHLLKQLRQAAARVRDRDVQRGLIRTVAEESNTPGLRKEARHLLRELKHERSHAADHLQQLLQKQHARIPHIFEELLTTLAPASSLSLSEADLIALARDVYRNHREPAPVPHDTAALHEIRKRAKLARYLAESAPPSATAAHRLAVRLERLQQAGGEWHDWLLLADLAAAELGDEATLPRIFAAHAQRALHAFQRRLRNFSPGNTSTPQLPELSPVFDIPAAAQPTVSGLEA